jgi:membrane protease YdiL (CAAX protease family)
MTSYDHFLRLLVMIGLIIGGLIATALVSAALMLMGGLSLTEIMEMSQKGTMDFSPTLIRGLLMVQHMLTFIIPGLAFGLIFFQSKFLSGLDLGKNPGLPLTILGIFFLMAAYPLVNLSFLVNEAIPLPAWASAFESQAEDTLKAILQMDTPLIFLFNLVIIAILPGIGEELIFRGILQKQIGGMLKNPIVAIWISAIIFSAIHLQFEGFFPRMVLGVVLGYLYHWTGNLWVPMLAHAFNNGIQIVLIYVTGLDVTSFDEKSSDQLQWWMLPISIGVMYFISIAIHKNRKFSEQA